MESYTCNCCGKSINLKTMKCEYCGTSFQSKNLMKTTTIRIDPDNYSGNFSLIGTLKLIEPIKKEGMI